MYLDNNNNFLGKIDGKNIYSYSKKDYKLNTVEERINYINELFGMYEVDGAIFYDEYWDEVYNQDRKHSKIDIVLNRSKSIYSTSNIALALEKVADYILKVDDYKDEDERNYVIYNSEELFNRACQEYNVTSNLARINGGLGMMGLSKDKEGNSDNDDSKNIEQNAFPFFQLPKNFNLVKDLKIEKEDLIKYPEINDYNEFYLYLKDEYKKFFQKKKLNSKDMRRKCLIRKVLSELKKDMIVAKKELERPIIWKAPLKPTGCPDYDELDMFDKNTVKELLRVHKQVDLQDDLSCILVDLDNLINKINFTERQQEVLKMWSNGLSTDVIAKGLNVKPQTITGCLNSIIDLIVKQYEEDYENWYYLNIRKGTYKKCSRCGEVKLVSGFDKDKTGKLGVRGYCKKCYNRK
ncbi:MAG: LuxR C-terminal-related transcriptional regulator [Bacilli bacterium]